MVYQNVSSVRYPRTSAGVLRKSSYQVLGDFPEICQRVLSSVSIEVLPGISSSLPLNIHVGVRRKLSFGVL